MVEMLIKFFTAEGDVVLDQFAGSHRVPLAAELNNRRWISTELHAEYVLGGALCFDKPWINPELARLFPTVDATPA